ncbi:MAG: SulP family inorganic anion transporter, partial [Bacteroidia bacterium]
MDSKSVVADLRSAIVVFFVAMPLCLGIAMACGAPLFSGIIAGVTGGLVVGMLSGSACSVSGPAAGLTAIIISSVAELGSFPLFLAAVVVAGVVQIMFGVSKAGRIGHYIPTTVVKGMLAGIGIILIAKQVPHLVGYDADPEGDMEFWQNDGHNTFSDLFYMLNYITPGSFLIGLVSLLILVLIERIQKKTHSIASKIPAPLVVVICAAALAALFSGNSFFAVGPGQMVKLPKLNPLSDLSQYLISPDYSALISGKFWLTAVTLAAVSSLETLLSLEAIEKLDPQKRKTDPNKELMAQGVGNITSGLLGGLPITSVIVRSAANINAGAKTKLSAMLHALLLLMSVLLFPQVLMLIPNSALAAILIMTGYKLTSLKLFREQFKGGRDQFFPFVATIVVMLFTDLLKGVGAGIILAVVFIIRDTIRSPFDSYREMIGGEPHYIIKLPQHLTFFNKGSIINYFSGIENNSTVIIDGSASKTVN